MSEDQDYETTGVPTIGPSVEEREMYARASIASDLIRNGGTIISAPMLIEQADAIWQWVKSGKK